MTEQQLTETIADAERLLADLYRQRRGRAITDAAGQIIAGWCVICGRAQVDCHAGFDTCHDCTGPTPRP